MCKIGLKVHHVALTEVFFSIVVPNIAQSESLLVLLVQQCPFGCERTNITQSIKGNNSYYKMYLKTPIIFFFATCQNDNSWVIKGQIIPFLLQCAMIFHSCCYMIFEILYENTLPSFPLVLHTTYCFVDSQLVDDVQLIKQKLPHMMDSLLIDRYTYIMQRQSYRVYIGIQYYRTCIGDYNQY